MALLFKMAASMRQLPVVVVLGSTGTGKSKLALQLGKMFNGEIISADSMQVYKGLDISTNKVTAEELKQCPHHMIGFLSPLTRNYTVTDYRDATLPIIESLLREGKLPIIVGGTSYYIESLLWNFVVSKQDIERAIKEEQSPAKRQRLLEAEPVDLQSKTGSGCGEEVEEETCHLSCNQDPIPVGRTEPQGNSTGEECHTGTLDIPVKNRFKEYGDGTSPKSEKYNEMDPEVLLKRLKEVDPEMALMIHPNNRRKIVRALEMYDTHRVKLSSVHRAQREMLSSQSPSGPLRFQNTCVFWLQSDLQELGKRTDERVDKMIERGLLDELRDFHEQYNADRLQQERVPDYTQGLFQSIGFKEFHDYLVASEEERNTDKGRQLFNDGVQNLKKRTRAYAKYQVKHIRNRYIKRRGANVLPVYGLDVSDTSQWEDKVKTPAVEILTDILQGKEPRHAPIPCDENDNYRVHEVCDICRDGRVFYTSQEWNSHLNSKRHERRKYLRKKEQRLKEKEADACQAGKGGDNSMSDIVCETNAPTSDCKREENINRPDKGTTPEINIPDNESMADSITPDNGSEQDNVC